MPLDFLHDHHTINILTPILVVFAGLYTYQGLLGSPGGLLRQLLVGIPLGVVFGVGDYFLDVSANHVLSNTLRELFQSSAIPVSSITIGVVGFVSGLILALVSPSSFRQQSKWQRPSIPAIVLLFLFTLVSGTLWYSICVQALLRLFSFHPPLFAVIAVAFVLSMIAAFNSILLLERMGSANSTAPDTSTTPGTPKATLGIGSCIVSLVLGVPGIGLFIYYASVIGWGTLIYLGAALVAGMLVYLIQVGVDKLTERGLLEISLVLFLLAAVLQLYQAIVQ